MFLWDAIIFQDPLRYIIPLFLCYSCLSSTNEKTLYGTENVTISRQCISVLGKYTAINVTLSLSESDLQCSIYFSPAICNSIKTDSYKFCSEAPSKQQQNHVRSSKYTLKIAEGEYDLSNLPDLSLWTDRSILIAGFHRWNLKVNDTICPKFHFCPIPSPTLPSVPLDTCDVELGEVMGDCRAGTNEIQYYMFPLATGFSIEVSETGSNLNKEKSDLNFVVSSGYRLGPGDFTCPEGLFACDSFIYPREYRLNWTYRICLPKSLWCDGVPNCPYSASDEQYCASNRSYKPQRRSFPIDPVIQAQELEMLEYNLDKYQDLEFLFTPEVIKRPNHLALSHIQLAYLILLGVFVIVLLIALTSVLAIKRKRRKRRQNVKNESECISNDGKTSENAACTWALATSPLLPLPDPNLSEQHCANNNTVKTTISV